MNNLIRQRIVFLCLIGGLFSGISAGAATVYVSPGGTVPTVIPFGDTYICEGAFTFYGTSISVSKGAKLIIRTGATLKMTGKITVMEGSILYGTSGTILNLAPGGTLTVQNSTVTRNGTTPTSRWYGIEVRGSNPVLFGTYDNLYEVRGKVFINGSTLSYATCAIKTATKSGYTSYTNKGGIIQSSNSIYLNNDTMVLNVGRPYTFLPPTGGLMAAPLNGHEYFLNCTFRLDNNYNSITMVQPCYVRLIDATGIKFLACKFLNEKYYGTHYNDRSVSAIYAMNSHFKVSNTFNTTGSWIGSGMSSATGKSLIDNFYDGIITMNGGGLKLVTIEGTEFDNVAHGVVLQGTNLSRVTNDTFSLTQIGTNPYSGNTPLGDRTNAIELMGCYQFQVTDNVIDGINGNYYSYGIAIADAGDLTHYVRRNTVRNTKYALRGTFYNQSWDFYFGGLKFTCNDVDINNNKNSSYDISSWYEGIAQVQGYYTGEDYQSPKNLFGTKLSGGYHVYNEPGEGNITYVNHDFHEYKAINITDNVFTADGIGFLSCNPYPGTTLITIPSGINARIEAASDQLWYLQGISNRTPAQEQELIETYDTYFAMVDTVIYHYIFMDSTEWKLDAVRQALTPAKGNIYHQILLAQVYMTGNSFDEASSVLSNIAQDFDLTSRQGLLVGQLLALTGVYKRYYEQDGNWESLSASDRLLVEDLKDNGIGSAKYMARAIWFGHNEYNRALDHFDWGVISNPQNRPGTGPEPELNSTHTKIYPNPATNSVTLDLGNLYRAEGSYSFELYNQSGVRCISGPVKGATMNIDLGDYPPGMYLIRIFDEKDLVGSHKIVLTH